MRVWSVKGLLCTLHLHLLQLLDDGENKCDECTWQLAAE